jgi:hypothetical protein
MRPPDREERRPPGRKAAHEDAANVTAIVTAPRVSPLRAALDKVIAEQGCSLKDLTVLDTKNDPFRIDTPARHRDGRWLATTAQDLGLGDRKIHLRGLHYMMIGRPKPDGTPYRNTDEDWLWLSGTAGKAARFLGYIPFDQITDQRNTEPVIRKFTEPVPSAYLTTEIDVSIPQPWELEPRIEVEDFKGVQPYRLALIGEKSSLTDILAPLADSYQADLYLPTGEISDTQIYLMSRAAAEDDRPLVVLYFADCDPAGWQMGISVGRKLQAMRELLRGFEFELHRVALTPDQVTEYGLPSTPLKETEKRADHWRQAMGVEQTEIDALASLRPDLLRELARDAITPFFDHTLDGRVFDARSVWLNEAQAAVDRAASDDLMEAIRADAARQLEAMREKVAELNAALRIDPEGIEVPPFEIPEPVLNGNGGKPPLISSRWEFAEQCRTLIDSKAYRGQP